MKKILIILAHPNPESLSTALGLAYGNGAQAAGAEVRLLPLAGLKFDPILHHGYAKRQPLEPDLEAAWQDILWADHLVFSYPNWWATFPALLKGFIDRLFLPGLAFEYSDGGLKIPKGLLAGRTARLLVTMDSPGFYYRWFLGAPGHRAMKKGVLEFVGISKIRSTSFYKVKYVDKAVRGAWVQKAEMLGLRCA
jgi:putative NADPH-quinone reductase